MTILLLIMGLTIYQDNHTYESDIIKYQTDKNYILCESPGESCPEETEKIEKEKYESRESRQKSKVTIPVLTGDILPSTTKKAEKIDSNKGEKALRNTKQLNAINDENLAVEEIVKLVKDDHAVDPNIPFAITPAGYYDAEHEEILMAKLRKQEDASMADQNIIEKLEVHFISDDEGLFPVTSHAEKLINISAKYRDNSFRITGYGLDEDEAKLLVISVVEILGETIFVEDVKAVSDGQKRIVTVEVLDEIR